MQELLRELSIPLVPTINLQQICAKKNIQISYRPLERRRLLTCRVVVQNIT